MCAVATAILKNQNKPVGDSESEGIWSELSIPVGYCVSVTVGEGVRLGLVAGGSRAWGEGSQGQLGNPLV